MTHAYCPSDHQLRELLDEQLCEADRKWIGRHLADCATCQAFLDGETQAAVDRQTSAVETKRVDPEATALVDLLKRLKHDPPRWPTQEPSPLRFPGPVTPDAPLGQVANYRILAKLGSGASGDLFQAFDTRLTRMVAIKVLRQDLSSMETSRARFEREARAAASLDHDNIVTIHDVVSPNGFPPYLVMELIDGHSLKERLRQDEGLSHRKVVQVVQQIAMGLATAHAQGVVHRDIKPSNIMLDRSNDRAKIADFGLAREIEEDTGITVDGMIAGTPSYMSPEQIKNPRNVDGRSDVYSLGVVLYESLTGERPFRGAMRMVLMQVLNKEPLRPRQLDDRIPRDLETICLKAMAKDPGQRYQSSDLFADDLGRWISGEPVTARPIGVAGRLWRWCRRNPRIAALSGLVAGMVLVVFGGWTFFTFREISLRQQADINSQVASNSGIWRCNL